MARRREESSPLFDQLCGNGHISNHNNLNGYSNSNYGNHISQSNNHTQSSLPYIKFEKRNQSQIDALQSYAENDITFLLGPAGCGKTYVAIAIALQEIYYNKKEKIVLTRPAVESGERLGFLPGDLEEKIDPFLNPFHDCMNKLAGKNASNKDKFKNILDKVPLAYMRGRTFDNSVCILDEAQNCTLPQIRLFLTRIGEGSRMIITGDPDQSDLPGPCVLNAVTRRFQNVSGIGIVKFNDDEIVRHPVISKVLSCLKGL